MGDNEGVPNTSPNGVVESGRGKTGLVGGGRPRPCDGTCRYQRELGYPYGAQATHAAAVARPGGNPYAARVRVFSSLVKLYGDGFNWQLCFCFCVYVSLNHFSTLFTEVRR